MDTAQTISTDDLLEVMHRDGATFRVRYDNGYATFKPEHDCDEYQRTIVCLWDVEFEARGGAVRGNVTATTDPRTDDLANMVEALVVLLGACREVM